MRRRKFIHQTAIWGGGLMLAGGNLAQISSASPDFTGFSHAQQAFLREVHGNLQAHLDDQPNKRQLIRSLLHPTKVLQNDVRKDYLLYQNGAGNYVVVKKRNDAYRISFVQELPQAA